MNKIQCPWTSCKFNSSTKDKGFGECNFDGIIDLHNIKCEVCEMTNSLTCESYEPYEVEEDTYEIKN